MSLPYPKLTRDDPERFAACLNTLAAATTTTIDDAHYEAFWKPLQDLPIAAVEEAAQRLLKRDSPFLPSAGQWFTLADSIALAQWEQTLADHAPRPRQVEGDAEQRVTTAKAGFFAQLATFIGPERAERLKAGIGTGMATYACPQCEDRGWLDAAPDPTDLKRVGYTAHCVRRCPCAAHNPVLERQRAARAQRRVG
jgi:hypothetical protein